MRAIWVLYDNAMYCQFIFMGVNLVDWFVLRCSMSDGVGLRGGAGNGRIMGAWMGQERTKTAILGVLPGGWYDNAVPVRGWRKRANLHNTPQHSTTLHQTPRTHQKNFVQTDNVNTIEGGRDVGKHIACRVLNVYILHNFFFFYIRESYCLNRSGG